MSGTPTLAGTFLVLLTVSDGQNTLVTNLSMRVASNAGSALHWNYFGIPADIIEAS